MSSRPKPVLPRTRNAYAVNAPSSCHQVGCSCGQRPCLGDGVLDSLPPQEQEIVILASFYGLAKDEIAGVIGKSVSVVDALLSQALEHLRGLLSPPTHTQAA